MKCILTILLLCICPIVLAWPHAPAQGDSTTMRYLEKKQNKKLDIWYALTQGDAFLYKGELGEAEKKYKEAYHLIEPALAQKKGHRISVFNETIFDPMDRLGHLYLLTNNLRKAEYYFKLSQKLRNVHLPAKSIFRVPPLVGLGEVYLAKNDLQQAEISLLTAEKIFNGATTSFYNHGNIGKTLLFNQFELSLKKKAYKKAGKYLELLSTGGFGQGFDKNVSSKFPRVFELKARYYLETGEYEKAHYYVNKARLFAHALSDALINFRILKTEALLFWAENKTGQAAKKFTDLTNAYKAYIIDNFAAMSEYEREGFFAKLKEDFDLFNSFAIQNRDFPSIDQCYETAYNNQLFSKALLLNQINKIKDNILQSGDQRLVSKLKEWEAAKAYLSSLYYQKKVAPQEINATEAKINELEKELNRQTSLLDDMGSTIEWRDIQGKLKPGEVAVEIIRTRPFVLHSTSDEIGNFSFGASPGYLVMAIAHNSPHPLHFVIDNGHELETRYLNYYRNAIRHQLDDQHSYGQFWLPIKNQLANHKRAYLSTDGVFNQINLNTIKNPQTSQYILDETDLVLVTNTKDLYLTDDKVRSREARLFGRPQYLSDTTSTHLDSVSLDQSELRSMDARVFDNFRSQVFVDLPGTQLEVKSIDSLLTEKAWNVEASYGPQATERNLKGSANPYVLHIATHGFFLQENNHEGVNSMIRSGIILAGVDKESATSNDDGVLTAYEATNLQLDSTYLVVLSACETGLGETKNGEGVYGLQRGLKVAGAKYVLMSLWKVNDLATRSLMESFYNNWLSGSDIHSAFKAAQMELRAKYPHPYYWGAFVLLGN